MSARLYAQRNEDDEGPRIELMGRFEADDGTIGDMFETVRPGQTVFGRTYEEWLEIATTVGSVDAATL